MASESNLAQSCVANNNKRYDILYKLAAVQMAERTFKSESARRFTVDMKRVGE